jgi:hypothetical protein
VESFLSIMPSAKQAKIKENELSQKGSTRIERGIYRVNYPSHKGIRAYLKFKDTEYQKVFSIGVGGERKSLALARAWRKERLKEIQNLPEAKNPLKKQMKNNTSGITGVRRGKTAWSATWVENKKQQHRSFAVEKFGEQEAFKSACQARSDAEKRMYGQVFQDVLKNELAKQLLT